ncbi:hypothetical protein M8C21_027597, partial [Ambrosia artemisiifolia]
PTPSISSLRLLRRLLTPSSSSSSSYVCTFVSYRGSKLLLALSKQRLIYRSLISNYVKTGLINKALQLFDEMSHSDCRVFSIDYNRIIGVLICHSRFELVELYYDAMIPKGLVDIALRVLECMAEKGREPDVVSYTTVISGLMRVRQVDQAVEMWRSMIGKGIRPDAKACRALVLGLCGVGKTDLAYELTVGVMKVDFSTSVYNALINGFCKAGRLDKAQAIMSFMRKNGCPPELLMLDEAERLMKVMERNGMELDSYSYNQIIKGFCKANLVEKAYALMVRKMEVKGVVDVVSYNTIIRALCKGSRVKRAYELFEEMGIKAFLREGNSSLAKTLLDKMTEMGLVPDRVLYTTTIDYMCKIGRISMAHTIFCDMIEHKITPDVVSYNAIISGFCKASKVSEAMNLFEQMQVEGLYPDEVTYKLIIGGLVHENKLSLACTVWEQMMDKGFTLDRDISEALINAINSEDSASKSNGKEHGKLKWLKRRVSFRLGGNGDGCRILEFVTSHDKHKPPPNKHQV